MPIESLDKPPAGTAPRRGPAVIASSARSRQPQGGAGTRGLPWGRVVVGLAMAGYLLASTFDWYQVSMNAPRFGVARSEGLGTWSEWYGVVSGLAACLGLAWVLLPALRDLADPVMPPGLAFHLEALLGPLVLLAPLLFYADGRKAPQVAMENAGIRMEAGFTPWLWVAGGVAAVAALGSLGRWMRGS